MHVCIYKYTVLAYLDVSVFVCVWYVCDFTGFCIYMSCIM